MRPHNSSPANATPGVPMSYQSKVLTQSTNPRTPLSAKITLQPIQACESANRFDSQEGDPEQGFFGDPVPFVQILSKKNATKTCLFLQHL